eukprot:637319-Prymnesium_polylepis.1
MGGGGVHHGGVVQHCVDIARGSHQVARGTGLTKEPVVAAAYGHQQRVTCVRRDAGSSHTDYMNSPARRARCGSTRPSCR